MEEIINEEQLRLLKDISSDYSQLDGLYFFSRLRLENGVTTRLKNSPVKIKGMLVMLVLDGQMTVEINLEQYVIGANTLLALSPGVVFNPKSIDNINIDAYLMFMSENFCTTSISTFRP